MLFYVIRRHATKYFSSKSFHADLKLFSTCNHHNHEHNHLVLGIETSCDDTGVGIVSHDGHILSNVVSSQLKVHLDNGGIIPPVAKNLHMKNIDSCVAKALTQANVSVTDLSAIAVTVKPGMPLSLIVGKNYARTLALKYNKPLIPIHHMEAHALVAMMMNKRTDNSMENTNHDEEQNELTFPFVTLLISGGHCLLAIAKNVNHFLLLGKSLNDAPGDILDKVARNLKLKNLGPPYDRISGGAQVELIAKEGNGNPLEYFNHHRYFPLKKYRTCDVSFSSVGQLVHQTVQRLEEEVSLEPDQVLPQASHICASLQYFIATYLIKRLQRAFTYIQQNNLFDGKPIQLVISGGCAANQYITQGITAFCRSESVQVFVPPKSLCTDNGVMIAFNAILKLKYEHEFPGCDLVLRNKKDIEEADIDADAVLGEDIRDKVNQACIPFMSIKFQQLFRQANLIKENEQVCDSL